MEYNYSRHAKRRAKLYNLAIEDIEEIMNSTDMLSIQDGQQVEIVDDRFIEKYKYPLKIIFRKEKLKILIITNYPLKRRLYEN